jgi:7-cyano-7-deazaguanine tRNA-ribosyltransferase
VAGVHGVEVQGEDVTELEFEVRDKDLAGRVGRLKLRSGTLETPAFFPVVHPFKQDEDLPLTRVRELGFGQVITNAYIIMRTLGGRPARVGELLGFDGIVMTDSGAYQLLVYGLERIQIDPIELASYEEVLEPDIAVIVDIPTPDTATREEAEFSASETLRRAYLTLDIVRRSSGRIAWVLPVQGGVHLDVLRSSAERSRELLDYYAIYAVGSPVKALEKYELWRVVDMVFTVRSTVPLDKPLHLFGGGHPLIIPIAVALGVDFFDSASYVLYARDGRYMTPYGTLRLEQMSYFPCDCPVCRRYEPADLLEMPRSERVRLLAEHNLSTIGRTVREVKEAIREGRLWELLERFSRYHPSAREAFTRLLKYVRWVERLDSRFKGATRGLFLVEYTSYWRPELVRHRNFLRRYVEDRLSRRLYGNLLLVPGDPKDKPFAESRVVRAALEVLRARGKDLRTYLKLAYTPYFDLVPLEVSYTYPYSQYETSRSLSRWLVDRMVRRVAEVVSRFGGRVVVVTYRRYRWSSRDFLEGGLCKLVDCGRVEFLEIQDYN